MTSQLLTLHETSSQDHLLATSSSRDPSLEWNNMESTPSTADGKRGVQVTNTQQSLPSVTDGSILVTESSREERRESTNPASYRVYKRRWFGLFQLVLLNIIVSWDVCIPPYVETWINIADS